MENREFIKIKDNGPICISFDNKPNNQTLDFVKTLENNNWNYCIIGIGEEWKGWITRTKSYRSFLDKIEPNRLVVLSDARDVFCLRSPDWFESEFDKKGCKILVGLEIFCQSAIDDSKVLNESDRWQCEPLYRFWHNKDYSPKIGKFVNSGLISGRVSDLIKYFDWVIESGYTDDQLALGKFMNQFPDLVDADIDNRFFHNSTYAINGTSFTHKQWQDSPSLAELTGRGAFFLHIPGLSSSKGQSKVYNLVRKLILEEGINSDWIREGYEGWYGDGRITFDKGYFDKR